MASDMRTVWLTEYLKCWNATEAARRAGYKWPNKKGPEIKQELAEEIQEKLAELTMTADEALILMTRIARGDLSQYIYPDGDIGIEELKESGDGRLLKKYKRVKTSTTRKNGDEYDTESLDFEFYPADAAIRDILKIHGKYGPLGTDDDPIQHRVKFIDYGLAKDDDTDTDTD